MADKDGLENRCNMDYNKVLNAKQVEMPAELDAPSWLVERGEEIETQEEKERVLSEHPGVNGLVIAQQLEQAQAQIQAALAELAQIKAANELYVKALVESQCCNYELRCEIVKLRAQLAPKAQQLVGGFKGV